MRRFIDRVMHIGVNKNSDRETIRVTGLLSLLCLFMTGFSLLVIGLDLLSGEFEYATTMGGVLLFILGIWFGLSRGVNLGVMRILVLVGMDGLVLFLVVTEGVEHSALLWILMLPLLSLFVFGLKYGLISLCVLFASLSVILFYPVDTFWLTHYADTFKIRILLVFFGISLISAIAEYSRMLTQTQLVAALERQQRAEAHRKRLEEQLRQSQKMEAVGQLAGGIAHDFNNLLTAIITYADFVKGGMERIDPARSDLDVILGAAGRAADLTTQLLAFSRRQVIQPKVLNLDQLIDSMAPMLKSSLNESIDLIIRKEDDLGKIKADRRLVKQVITNLTLNARDALRFGGRLIIETGNAYIKNPRISAIWDASPGDFVTLAVGDTGDGIPPKDIERLFEPFFTTKEKGEGTGLGLSTVFGIVKQHSGFIEVTSKPSVGTVITVYWPRVYERGVSQSTITAIRPESVPSQKHILLVEDDEMVRRSARRILASKGYQIIEANSGENALEIVSEGSHPIDLLLSDVIMTGMTGVELAEQLVELMPLIPIVLMSGYTQDAVGEDRMLAKEFFYLQKPFTKESLLSAVEDKL